MPLIRKVLVGFLWAAAGTALVAQPASREAGRRLWADFLAKYESTSLKPLDAAAVDEKARTVLLEVSGVRFRAWKPNAKPTLPELAEAMADADPTRDSFLRVEDVLDALLPRIDRYGHYHRASDVSRLAEAMRQNPGGVHMTLDRAPDGTILCYPLEGGPAAAAGISNGAVLLAVDGIGAAGKSLSALRLLFVGPPDSEIRVKLRQPHGKTEEFVMKRTGRPIPSVIVAKSPLGLTIRIRKFDASTARKVKEAAEENTGVKRLTLDLRGNPGGLWNEVLKVASLFFPEGAALGTLTDKEGTQTARDGNGVILQPESIRIQQDGRTASAAEFLAACLREGLPGKVKIFGGKSYGKGHSTLQVALEGGGQLVVTDALLGTAKGFHWDGEGILPEESSPGK